MLVRVRSPGGMKRINVEAHDRIETLLRIIEKDCNLVERDYSLFADVNGVNVSLTEMNLNTVVGEIVKHGDILTIKNDMRSDMAIDRTFETSESSKAIPITKVDSDSKSGTLNANSPVPVHPMVVEDAVDREIRNKDGLIVRKRDKTMCQHGPRGMCDHCRSLDPWDETYLKENNIKHMSFHAFLRKQSGGVDKGKFVSLADTSVRIKPGCTSHPPWPEGICSKCQPSAVTLKRQVYRHTDHIEFESSSVVNQFVQFWRQSGGAQRFGFLYGRYEAYDGVPLGIKAVVMAVYEPKQRSDKANIRVEAKENNATQDTVDKVAGYLGLQRVGWIFTDLEDDGTNQGTVLYKRHADTFFLSSLEAMTAADYQTQYPNICRDAENGRFGSKFVSVSVSGSDSNHVGLEAYQVSDQAMALYRDNCLRPSRRMGRGRIAESTATQYVPDVFHSHKNEYGAEETLAAKPTFPLDYLLVNVSVGSPQVPDPMFTTTEGVESFPLDNRSAVGEVQSVKTLAAHMRRSPTFLSAVSNFHLLCYLACSPVFGLGDKIKGLCEAVKDKNVALADQWRSLPEWKTVEMMMEEPGAFDHVARPGSNGMGETGTSSADVDEWACAHCTFINRGNGDCEMCGLPKNSVPICRPSTSTDMSTGDRLDLLFYNLSTSASIYGDENKNSVDRLYRNLTTHKSRDIVSFFSFRRTSGFDGFQYHRCLNMDCVINNGKRRNSSGSCVGGSVPEFPTTASNIPENIPACLSLLDVQRTPFRSNSDVSDNSLKPSSTSASLVNSPVGKQRSLDYWQGISPEETLSHVVHAARLGVFRKLDNCRSLKVHLYYMGTAVWVESQVDVNDEEPVEIDLDIVQDKILYMKLKTIHSETAKACTRLIRILTRTLDQNTSEKSTNTPGAPFISKNSMLGGKVAFTVFGYDIQLEACVSTGYQ
eukprot:CFRG1646T1